MRNKQELEAFISESVREQLKRQGYGETYLTPEQLCERWKVTPKALEKWRLEGKPPIFMKVQASKKAIIRYPLQGENGVLDVEQKWLRNSTSDTGTNCSTFNVPAKSLANT